MFVGKEIFGVCTCTCCSLKTRCLLLTLLYTSEAAKIVFFLCFYPNPLCFIIFIYLLRASRDDMVANAAGSSNATAYPKSESQNSGLVGNIHGQDVEAAKVVY